MVECKKTDRPQINLFADADELTDLQYGDSKHTPEFDEVEVQEEKVVGDQGQLLVVRRVFFSPREVEGDTWVCNVSLATRCAICDQF